MNGLLVVGLVLAYLVVGLICTVVGHGAYLAWDHEYSHRSFRNDALWLWWIPSWPILILLALAYKAFRWGEKLAPAPLAMMDRFSEAVFRKFKR